MKPNLIIGQEVLVEPISGSNAARRSNEIIKANIETIGRKYFTLICNEGYRFKNTRFHIDTLIDDGGGYSSNFKVYLSEKELNDKIERPNLFKKIVDQLNTFDADQLREILKTINPEIPA